jgi:hypothetical protein
MAFHFHWPHAHLMAMEHGERQRWVRQIATMIRRRDEST